jgi:hypothetical protein
MASPADSPLASPVDLESVALAAPRYRRPDDLAPHDWAVLLLHSAAEVEHALMVQYLYAAYSLKADDSPIDGHDVAAWQAAILTIAREEMGHLLSVQNLLRLIGGPLCFEREDFPLRSQFYPFPFTLERLSRSSLAKYVFAEMTAGDISPDVLTAADREAIESAAREAVKHGGGSFVNHVGVLYDTLIDVFGALPADAFRTDREPWQVTGWAGTTPDPTTLSGIKLLPARTRDEALAALRSISQQGEASTQKGSHFGRFLAIYRAFPDQGDQMTWPVCENPTTNGDAPGATLVEDPVTLKWAQLFNLRYRVLLTVLAHGSALSETATSSNGTPLRPHLRSWTYDEMRPDVGSLGALAALLASLPAGPSGAHAGAPFDLPYTLVLPDQEAERWRAHRDLMDATQQVIADLRAAVGQDDNLDKIESRDGARRQQLEALAPED